MAYYNFGFNVPPRFNQIPRLEPFINPPPPRFLDLGQPRFIGDDLPRVDPFNYPGIVRFGPSYTIIGPHLPDIPPGAGVFDPDLVVPGVPTFNFGLPNPFILNYEMDI